VFDKLGLKPAASPAAKLVVSAAASTRSQIRGANQAYATASVDRNVLFADGAPLWL
jgi:hypothetical protein